MTDLSGLPLLRRLMVAAKPDERPVYAPTRLRFALEVPINGADGGQLRTELERLLNNGAFSFVPLFDDMPDDESRFFTFSPDGIDRTLPDEILFAIAADLRKALRLVSCEPDTGAQVYTEPSPAPPLMTEGAVLDATCWVQGTPPEPKTWALESCRVPEAWKLAGGKGEGVIVAQPDTGIATHQDLSGTIIDFSRTLNLLEGGTSPTDPLTSSMSNPGHGTGTASVLAARGGALLSGSAPGATIVPIRCINDVKVFDATPVARAVDHAVRIGAHVITMSLGGVFSSSLRAAIRRAVAADIIVLAAAGNCVGLVVWPARYAEVIAVGGTNQAGKKWKGSSSGSSVDFSAPAEQVWRALRSPTVTQTNGISAGQGTSFATALSAGVAALWLERHGRSDVIRAARQRGISVQALFRTAVRQSAHRPVGFPSGLGAGVIDAKALLDLPLAQISTAYFETAVPSDDPSGGLSEALSELFGPGRPDPEFDWSAHGAEVSALLLADLRAGRGQEGGQSEVRAFRQSSPALTEAAVGARDSRIAHLVLRGRPSAPAIMIPAEVSPERLARLLTGFGAAAQPELAPEAAASVSPERGQGMLDGPGREKALAPLRTHLARSGLREEGLLVQSDRALARLHANGTSARLDPGETMVLEALVALTERPAIPVTTRTTPEGSTVQTVDVDNPEFGRFAGQVALALHDLEQGILSSVGRIDGGGIHLGTGWMIAPGLIATNRHVLEEFAAPMPRLTDPDSWQIFRSATINFSAGGELPEQGFRITDVAFAGRDPIRTLPISFDKLDLALLRVELVNTAGASLPPHVPIGALGASANRNFFALGYPAPPAYLPRDEAGRLRQDVIERLRAIFGLSYRRKYFSPGMVIGTGHPIVFDHDATTLGGNSGSLIGSLSDKLTAVGLHFAGDWLRANHAHDLLAVLAAEPRLAPLMPPGTPAPSTTAPRTGP